MSTPNPSTHEWIMPNIPPRLFQKAQDLAFQEGSSVSELLLSLVTPSLEAMPLYLVNPDEDESDDWDEDEDEDAWDEDWDEDDYDYEREHSGFRWKNSRQLQE